MIRPRGISHLVGSRAAETVKTLRRMVNAHGRTLLQTEGQLTLLDLKGANAWLVNSAALPRMETSE